jgi:hypothetical protein
MGNQPPGTSIHPKSSLSWVTAPSAKSGAWANTAMADPVRSASSFNRVRSSGYTPSRTQACR